MKSHEKQSERMHKQAKMHKENEQIQLILQHIQMNNLISDSSDPTTSDRHKAKHIRDDSLEEY